MFKLSQKKYIPLSKVEVQSYIDDKFSTRHIHLESESNEKCFVVAFKTLPNDSSGVAHILEHTVLCGSKKYPVRDPFFMMTRRSLSTFMNAFTASDFTAYPFSTLNDKDFSNLLSVYLDATFFPNLNELDFMQEGHRFDFAKNDKSKDQIVLKGIVYNEMKGAMSSISSQADQGLNENLFPNHTYGYNSGGDPQDIPKLTYQNLLEFHKKHYHPSNAIFFTYGKINIPALQNEIQINVLKHFSPSAEKIEVKESKSFRKPKYALKNYKPLSNDENNHHVLVSWLLGTSLDPVDKMEAKLIESILLENSASPLSKALEVTNLGSVPSDMTSFDTYKKQMYFTAGLEGVLANQEMKVEELIVNVFQSLVKDGIPQDLIDSSLHQIEIKLKKISGGFPYGLQLLMSSMPYILHDADVVNSYDLETSLESLKKRITKKDYLENRIREMFLDNPSRLTFQLVPDKDYDQKQDNKIKEFLISKQKSLTDKEKEKINQLNAELDIRQNKKDDPNILPKVTVSDIGNSKTYPKFEIRNKDSVTSVFYKAGTNGIDYFQKVFPVSEPTFNDLKYSSLFADIICEVGIKNKSYEEIQKRQSSSIGQISSNFTILRENHKDIFDLAFKIGGYSLQSNLNKLKDLFFDTLEHFRLDEKDRINDITKMHISGFERNLINSGHYFAMTNSDAQISKYGAISEYSNGISYLKNLKDLKLSDGNINVEKLIESFANLKKKIVTKPITEVLVSSGEIPDTDNDEYFPKEKNLFELKNVNLNTDETAWITETEVNFCAQSFKTVNYTHDDAPTLSVLGSVLRNGFLHTAIREKGGAYGAGAMQDMSARTFKFFSYRDPNIEKTFEAFGKSVNWALKSITNEKLEEGILNVISSIDKPSSPASEALSDFNSNYNGFSQEMRKKFRENILSVNIDKLVYVSEKYLTVKPSRAVLTSKKNKNIIDKLKFKTKYI